MTHHSSERANGGVVRLEPRDGLREGGDMHPRHCGGAQLVHEVVKHKLAHGLATARALQRVGVHVRVRAHLLREQLADE
eukprot:8197365-Pyramimonas_sp.AAC.1